MRARALLPREADGTRIGARAALLLGLLLALGSGAAAADDWPFGAPRGGFGLRGGDDYNLGLLGAKARDADAHAAPVPAAAPGGGVRRGTPAGPEADEGPLRLEVVRRLPGGPAEAAGLQVGDVIVGLGRRVFQEHALDALAEALVKAEAGAHDGVLTLLVERAGKREKLAVPIPSGGKAAKKPLRPPARLSILRKALAYLADRQQAGGGFAQTLSGSNGAVVMASLAGLGWLSDGSDVTQGTWHQNVERAADFVAAWCARPGGVRSAERGGLPDPRMKGAGNWNQNNWGYAHAAIFLGALVARSPKPALRRALATAAAELVKGQEQSGGWAHGPGGPNGLGYVELNIVTGLALMGLGMARRAGVEVPDETVERADAYLRASSSGDGGIGYSTSPGQKGQGNIGRSAAAWLGYRLLGLGKGAWAGRVRKYVSRNVDAVFGGHASLMQHVLLAGLAAHALGKRATTRYWARVEHDMTLARVPDGSLQPRPWHESLGMGTNSDVTFGQVWTTAAWALVLGCEPAGKDHPGLPRLLGRS